MPVVNFKHNGEWISLPTIKGRDGRDGEWPLYFADKVVAAEDWVVSTVYSDYGFEAVIPCEGVNQLMWAELTLPESWYFTGKISPIVKTGTDTVTIYSNIARDELSIPLIKVVTTR